MVNLRSTPVELQGVRFELQAVDSAPYYFAGQVPRFRLWLTNPTAAPVSISAEVIWEFKSTFRDLPNTQALPREVPPGPSVYFDLRDQWLPVAGEVVYKLRTPAGPLSIGVNEEIHPLASYRVFDWGLKQEEDARWIRADTLQRRTLVAFVASVAANVVLAAATLYFPIWH